MATKKTRKPRDRSAGWSVSEAMRQKEIALARLRRIDADAAAGKLIEVDAVRQAWAQIMAAVRSMVLGLPGRIAFDVPGLTPQDRATIERLCHDGLTDCAMQRGYDVLGGKGRKT
jgi:hypothetical protein